MSHIQQHCAAQQQVGHRAAAQTEMQLAFTGGGHAVHGHHAARLRVETALDEFPFAVPVTQRPSHTVAHHLGADPPFVLPARVLLSEQHGDRGCEVLGWTMSVVGPRNA